LLRSSLRAQRAFLSRPWGVQPDRKML